MSNKKVDSITINRKNILLSLKTIKEVCEDNDDNCKMCPLYADPMNNCSLLELSPDSWEINEGDEVWRALL